MLRAKSILLVTRGLLFILTLILDLFYFFLKILLRCRDAKPVLRTGHTACVSWHAIWADLIHSRKVYARPYRTLPRFSLLRLGIKLYLRLFFPHFAVCGQVEQIQFDPWRPTACIMYIQYAVCPFCKNFFTISFKWQS